MKRGGKSRRRGVWGKRSAIAHESRRSGAAHFLLSAAAAACFLECSVCREKQESDTREACTARDKFCRLESRVAIEVREGESLLGAAAASLARVHDSREENPDSTHAKT